MLDKLCLYSSGTEGAPQDKVLWQVNFTAKILGPSSYVTIDLL